MLTSRHEEDGAAKEDETAQKPILILYYNTYHLLMTFNYFVSLSVCPNPIDDVQELMSGPWRRG